MRANDLRVTESGEHIRVLLPMDLESYVVDCQHFRMPYAVSQKQLAETEPLQTEDYTVFVLDEDVSAAQHKERDRRLALIQPLMTDVCIYDKHHRNELLRGIIAQNSVNRRTVLLYLWRYWVYQSKNALLPQERPPKEARALTADERIFRWALNKFFYTPQRQSLQTAYKMMLQAKYCDARGRLLPQRPTFWQFRYFYRQHRDPINETISRQGIKAYQRNYRPITGSVSDYATTIGTFMTDATVADIYIVSRLSRKPIGRPAIYTMVDAYSRLITGVYVGLEGGQYALRLLLQNTVADKVTYCLKYGIEIDAGDWPSHHLPARILTDRGTEFLSGPLENLCESYQVEIDTLPAYRPDLKGVVEKLFDLVQSAYKPLLKGRGVVETQRSTVPLITGNKAHWICSSLRVSYCAAFCFSTQKRCSLAFCGRRKCWPRMCRRLRPASGSSARTSQTVLHAAWILASWSLRCCRAPRAKSRGAGLRCSICGFQMHFSKSAL